MIRIDAGIRQINLHYFGLVVKEIDTNDTDTKTVVMIMLEVEHRGSGFPSLPPTIDNSFNSSTLFFLFAFYSMVFFLVFIMNVFPSTIIQFYEYLTYLKT